MINKINSKLFKLDFFLSGSKKVNSLESGAKLHGGATKFDDGIYSNIEGSDFIELKESDNEISIFIPSTVSIDKKADSTKQVNKSINYLKRFYDIKENLKYYKTVGSWYSEDMEKVVIENITVITLKLEKMEKSDIEIFVNLANIVKKDMIQEGVSLDINGSLAIV